MNLNGDNQIKQSTAGQTNGQYQAPQSNLQAQTPNRQLNTNAGTYNGMKGVSQSTGQKVAATQQNYSPSETVNQAMGYLNSVLQNRPGDWDNLQNDNYKQAQSILGQLTDRKFQYSLGDDMMYQNAADQARLQGQQAMMDTMGQAAAQTGGYGSSYGVQAGSNAYQQYLEQLNQRAPEFYEKAQNRFDDQTEQMRGLYDLYNQGYQTDFDTYKAGMEQYNQDRNFASEQYSTMYGQDYGQYNDDRNYWMNAAQGENSDYTTNRGYNYDVAMSAIQRGQVPDASVLQQAGISATDAQTMANMYRTQIDLQNAANAAQIYYYSTH